MREATHCAEAEAGLSGVETSMKPIRLSLIAALLVVLSGCGRGKKEARVAPPAGAVPEIVAEAGEPAAPVVPPPLDPAVPALTINKSAQVSVLGYHDFVKGKPGNAMQVSEDQGDRDAGVSGVAARGEGHSGSVDHDHDG